MSSVALAFVEHDRPLCDKLQTSLRGRGIRLRILPTEPSVHGSNVGERSNDLDTADAVLVIWTHSADYSDTVTQYAAQASDQQKLLIVRVDSTPLPRHMNAVVVELRGLGIDRAAVDAIQIAIEAIRADSLERSADIHRLPGQDPAGPPSSD